MTGALEKIDEPLRLTAKEFFALAEDSQAGKHQLIDGTVLAMPPASGTHALIQANIAILIGSHLLKRNSPCRVGTEAPIIPRMDPKHNNVRVPDIAVTCLPPSGEKAFPDPVLIIEVLSPSNEQATRDAIYACATIPTLREVMVVGSESIQIEIYRREENGDWPLDPQVATNKGTVHLQSIEVDLAVIDIYAGTVLGTP